MYTKILEKMKAQFNRFLITTNMLVPLAVTSEGYLVVPQWDGSTRFIDPRTGKYVAP